MKHLNSFSLYNESNTIIDMVYSDFEIFAEDYEFISGVKVSSSGKYGPYLDITFFYNDINMKEMEAEFEKMKAKNYKGAECEKALYAWLNEKMKPIVIKFCKKYSYEFLACGIATFDHERKRVEVGGRILMPQIKESLDKVDPEVQNAIQSLVDDYGFIFIENSANASVEYPTYISNKVEFNEGLLRQLSRLKTKIDLIDREIYLTIYTLKNDKIEAKVMDYYSMNRNNIYIELGKLIAEPTVLDWHKSYVYIEIHFE